MMHTTWVYWDEVAGEGIELCAMVTKYVAGVGMVAMGIICCPDGSISYDDRVLP